MTHLEADTTYDITEPGAGAAEIVPVLRQHRDSNEFNTIDSHPLAVILEFEDFSFHHDSAVTLPCLPSYPDGDASEQVLWEDNNVMPPVRSSNPDSYQRFREAQPPEVDPGEDPRLRRALVLIAVAYKFLEKNSMYALLVTGHTDTSGDDAVNFPLSDQRAASVLALLEGDADAWVQLCQNRSKVEDYQRILKHYAEVNAWNCDPGEVDNVHGPMTRQGVENFQSQYNESFNKSIEVDGVIGPQTWESIFEVYMDELAKLLDAQVSELDSYRNHLRFIDSDNKVIGCGERIPIDAPLRDSYRSAENRRVEILFFHQDRPPDLSAHLEGGKIRARSAGREASGVYGPGAHVYAVLEPLWWDAQPPNTQYSPQFEIVDIEEDIEALDDAPDSDEYDTEYPETPELGPEDDPWDFLDYFAEHHPGHGGAREVSSRGQSI